MTLEGSTALRGKRILITGGAGFVGTALAKRLSGGNEIVLLDRVFPDTPPDEALGDAERIVGDIRDERDMSRAVDSADVVIHTAAVVGVQRVMSDARGTIETNMMGTANLLNALTDKALDRFVFFSTSEVFGQSAFRVNEESLATVGTAAEPRWAYSISKLGGEHLAYAHYREFGFPAVIVRPFNVFGPGRRGDHAVLRFIRLALEGKPLEVHGDGAQVRSWCFIDDFIDAIVAMLERPEAIGEDFNIGNSRNTLSIYELAKLIVRLTESSSSIGFRAIDFSDVDIRVPDHSKAQRLLGYEPTVEIEDGLARTIEWCRNVDW